MNNQVFAAEGESSLQRHARGVLHINELHTSVLRPQFDGGVGSEALQVLRGQGDEVVGVLLQVADGVVLKEEGTTLKGEVRRCIKKRNFLLGSHSKTIMVLCLVQILPTRHWRKRAS